MATEVKDQETEVIEEKSVATMSTEELDAKEVVEEPEDKKTEEEDGKEDEKEDKEEKVTLTKKEYDALMKKREHQDKHINTLLTEKRDVVKKLKAKLAEAEEKLNEKWDEGGSEAAKAQREVLKTEKDLEEATVSSVSTQNEAFIKERIPEFDDYIDGIADLLKIDRVAPEHIREFQRNPYGFDVGNLINLAERHKIGLALSGKDTRLQELEKEIEELRKKPGEVIDKLNAATKKSGKLSGKSGGGDPQEKSGGKPTHMFTREELENL